jgi:heme O synthase-like polyprenyltransferase
VSGAIPPVIGWVAVPGGLEFRNYHRVLLRSELMTAPGAMFLFGLLFLWQLPHFLAINWMYREEYVRGGFVMWSNEDESGEATARRALGWSVLLLPLGVWPPLAGGTAEPGTGAFIALGSIFLSSVGSGSLIDRFHRKRCPGCR